MTEQKEVRKFKAQQDYINRKKSEGLARTTLLVPKEMLDEIKDVGLLMRRGEWVELADDEKPILDKVSRTRRQNARA